MGVSVACCAAVPPLRVAVFAPDATDAGALVTAEVSKIPGIMVVERDQIKLLISQQVVPVSPRERLALGRLLAADLLLLVEPKRNAFSWIDAQTGEELFRILEDSPAALARSAVALVEENRDAQEAGNITATVTGAEAAGHASGVVRAWLGSRGVRILDRVLAHAVVEERDAIEKGLNGKSKPLPAFPGAQFLLKVQAAGEGFRIKILAAGGSVLGISPMWNGRDLPPDVQAFLDAALSSSKQDTAPTFRQRLNLEALQPFYKGVSLFESGKPIEATAEFQRAYEINNLFAAAYLWEARCYEAAGLPEFAGAIRRWLETGFAGRGVAAGADASPRDGVTFLGVTDGAVDISPVATRLSMAAIEALSGPGLLLPESLGEIRDEYDLLAATTHTEGARWETSSGFVSRFTLRGMTQEGVCEWTLADSLSGKILATRKQKLPSDPGQWAEVLRGWLPGFAQSASETATAPTARPLSLPTKDLALAEWKKARGSADKNIALLQLLLLDPSDPVVIGGGVIKGSDEKDGLDNYMAHAKRDVLLRLLPKDHPMRPWIELDRIQTFMPWTATGPHISGEKRDSQADLKRFSEANPQHPAGVLARYFWLYDAQNKMPPAEVAAEASALSKRLSAVQKLPNSQVLAQMCDAIAVLGRAACGETVVRPQKSDPVPRGFKMEIGENGEVQTMRNGAWQVSEFRDVPLTPEEVKNEAGAALAIQGRGDVKMRVDPSWMDKFPLSFSISSYIAFGGIHGLLNPEGRPVPFAGDYAAMRGHWRRMVDYTADSLEYWLGRVRTPDEFRAVDYSLMFFFPALNETAFRISDEEYAVIHARLLAASAAAAARVGVPDKAPGSPKYRMLDWRQLTRAEANRQSRDYTISGPWFYLDVAALSEDLRKGAAEAFDQEQPTFKNWWHSMQHAADCMSYRQVALQFIDPHLEKIHKLYGHGALSDDERAMLLDVGIVLMWGWQYPEAEKIFLIVADAPAAVTSSERAATALRASALLHLARLQIEAKNKPAALATLERCLKNSEGLDIRRLDRYTAGFRTWLLHSPGQRSNIRSLAMRMLDELRFDPAYAVFPARCGAVHVETPQLENSVVTIFYRLPPPSEVPPRVLVVLPPFNEGTANICDDTSPWARFADAHNLALVVPQFFQVHTTWKMDHPCSPYHFPNIWSGQALIDGLHEIGILRKLDDRKLLFQGAGAGAQFAARFARWKPERTAALSLHSAGGYSWAEQEFGIQPISVLKGMPVLLTVGENDDFGVGNWDARAGTEIYHTILKGAGANVDLRFMPASSHRDTPELQLLSEAFVAKQLKSTGVQNP